MGRVFRFAQRVAFCLGGLPCLGVLILGMLALSPALVGQTSLGQTSLNQTSADQTSPDSEIRGPLPTDWSHHHLIFSSPGTEEQSNRVQQDARYRQQLARRSRSMLPATEAVDAPTSGFPFGPYPRPLRRTPRTNRIRRDWSENMGSGATVGAGQYPATFSAGSTPSCINDFAVFNTSLAGSATQASIIAYNKLYSGCGGTFPTVYWAYDTLGTITTSATLSADGSQVAFVELNGTVATLVLLKWKASTTETAAAPFVFTATNNVTNANYRTCTAPCMTTIAFHPTTTTDPTPTDAYSSPFYVYVNSSEPLYDTLYVGDDAGYLHQFTGVFIGTPAETTTTWPVEVGTANLSSPVYDSTTGNVFVTTSYVETGNTGGRIAAVCATSTCTGSSNGNVTVAIGTVTPSLVLGPTKTSAVACHGTGSSGDGFNLRFDAPIIDSAAGKAYVFVGNDGNGESAVIQFSTTVGTATGDLEYHTSCGTETTVGTASTTAGISIFAGTFDNLYFTSSGGDPTGNLYTCGNTSADATLYQIPITANVMATSGTSVLAVSTASTTCSPLTEVFSATGTDLIFFSVESSSSTASPVSCTLTTGCLMSFSVPTTSTGTLPTAPAATLAAAGGTSGIIIDNTASSGTEAGASQVYFSPLANQTCPTSGTAGGCAVQASQSALH
ncbi:MAG: hypothetical protein WCF42_20185 [Terriglobales bacterium]|jgi:hypothetical protein